MRNFSKWTLMYITCTPEPHPGLKCTKITTLWNHSNMCLYDTCYYDAIWYHYVTSTYDTWRVYDASSEWRRMMRTPRMNPVCSMHVCCVYVSEWYCYEVFVCMMHAPYETKKPVWVFYEVVWRKYERMTFSGRNDAYFGKKWYQSRPAMVPCTHAAKLGLGS